MDGNTRRKIERGSRVNEFFIANPSEEAGHKAIGAKIQETLARASQIAMLEGASRNEELAAADRRRQIRDQIEFGQLVPLAKVGRQASKEVPELSGKFRVTRSTATHQSFLSNARSMLAEAIAHKDVLVSQGMAASLPDDLARLLDRFEAESFTMDQSRRGHINARAELIAAADDLSDLIDVLDGFNRYRFQDEPEHLAAWNAARSVLAHTPRTRKTAPGSTDSGSPTAPTGGDTRAA
jgi:hypothetical protein